MHTVHGQERGQAVLKRLFLGISIALGTVLLMPATALAQDDAEKANSNTLEEVVVTATRREESLMEVPIAVTAMTGEELQNFGVLDLT